MQIVYDNWKNAHKQRILPESFVEVSLDITDPEALLGISSQEDNGAIYISDSSKLTNGVDETPTPYCTLEQNLWCLDGNRKAIPESNFGDNGFVSDALSDDACIFSTKLPLIEIRFREVFDKLIPGVTITWSSTYNEYADTFEVIAYNGENIVASKEVIGNKSVECIVLTEIKGYDRISIIVKKWCLPNHRARVEEIFIGLNKVYGKGELFDYSHTESVDPVSLALPKSEIKFSIDNVEGEYNPYNTNGLAKYLTERQEIKTRYGLKMQNGTIEWIKGGTFYLSEWDAKQNGMTADFTARDLLEFMSGIYHDNVSEIKERSLYKLATNVLNSANLPRHLEVVTDVDGKEVLNDTEKWVIDKSLMEIKTKAPLPEDTLANCLQLIANAGMCVIYQDRSGKLHIEPLRSIDTDYVINSFNSYTKSEITLSKPLKQVKVKMYTYSSVTDSTSTEISYSNDTSSEIKGEIITVDNPLITSEKMASDLGEWLYTHLGHRMTLDSSWRADVRLDPLDIVTNENEYNSNKVRITDIEYRYNGTFRGTSKGKVI